MVEEPIAEGVGDGGFAHGGVPVFGGELTGDDGGGPAVAVLDDFKEVGALLIGEGGQEDVVDDQELGLGKLGEELKTGTVGAGLLELLEEPGGAEGKNGESLASGEVAEGAGEPGLADAGGAGEEDVATGGEPARVGELEEELFLETAGVFVIDVLEAGVGLSEPGVFEQAGEAAVVAVGFFVLDE